MTAKELADAVIAAVKRALAPFQRQLEEVQQKQQALEQRVAELPAPEKGEKGDKGDPGDKGDAGHGLSAFELAQERGFKGSVEEWLLSLKGDRGDPGEDAEPGPRGPKGDSVTLAQVLMAIRPDVETALKNIPPPSVQSIVEALQPSLDSAHASWALDFERRAQGILERAVDRLPKPRDGDDGRDGTDGVGFDDMTFEHDGERGFTLRFQRGDKVKEFAFSVPVVIDRGFWKEGLSVAKGDGMTFGGSYWIAQADTATKPDIGNPDWRLAVKKGRDGKA